MCEWVCESVCVWVCVCAWKSERDGEWVCESVWVNVSVLKRMKFVWVCIPTYVRWRERERDRCPSHRQSELFWFSISPFLFGTPWSGGGCVNLVFHLSTFFSFFFLDHSISNVPTCLHRNDQANMNERTSDGHILEELPFHKQQKFSLKIIDFFYPSNFFVRIEIWILSVALF
jgi:hypothetical protein